MSKDSAKAEWLAQMAAEYSRDPFTFIMTHANGPEIAALLAKCGLISTIGEERQP